MVPCALRPSRPQNVAAVPAEPSLERMFVDARAEHRVADENVVGFFCIDLAGKLPVERQFAMQSRTVQRGYG